jgi:hypothetical protein
MTHGHYFESYWSLGAEWALHLAGDDLAPQGGELLALEDMVALNLPLSQLACSGIGQVHPLQEVVQSVRSEASAGRTDSLGKYLGRVHRTLEALQRPPALQRLVQAGVLSWITRRFLRTLESIEQARYSRAFFNRPDVRERFRRYFRQCLGEVAAMRSRHGVDLPIPSRVLFGHTHQPIPWDSEELVDSVDGHPVSLHNTGGWLLRRQSRTVDFLGAEVLVYETGQGIRSSAIRYCDLCSKGVEPLEPRIGNDHPQLHLPGLAEGLTSATAQKTPRRDSLRAHPQ